MLFLKRSALSLLVLASGLLAGCGESLQNDGELPSTDALSRFSLTADKQPAAGEANLPGGAVTATNAGLNRKIIYSACVDLVVENFDGVPDTVVALTRKFDGYVADSNFTGASGTNRQATWKIRVPVARFEEFVNAAKGLGELSRASTESRDVSEEYYDVDARIRNKTREEERLLRLLEDRPGKLEDVVAIERELSRVREELERMQGRLRVLADLTALTTVQLSITEIRGYQPPAAPTLTTRLRRAFGGSVAGLLATGEEFVVLFAAAAPWLAVLGLIGAPCFSAARATYRRRMAQYASDKSA